MGAEHATGKSFRDLYEEHRQNVKKILDEEIPAEYPFWSIREALYVTGIADDQEAIRASEQLLEYHIDRAQLTDAQREIVKPVKEKIKVLRENLLPPAQATLPDSTGPGG